MGPRPVYVTSTRGWVTGIVARYSGFDGRAFAHRRVIVPAISVGRHGLGTIAPGPNSRLYLGAGAEQDALAGGHETSGTVVSFKGDGSDLRIEAKGLRGPFGLAFIPGTASCWSPTTGVTTSACSGHPTSSTSCAT